MSWPAPRPEDRQEKPDGPVYTYRERRSEFYVDPVNPILDHWYEIEPGGWYVRYPRLPDGLRD
jgi:hypothetical protein